MLKYSLCFEADNEDGEQTLTFYARSTTGALDTAKLAAEGEWAELYQDKRLICRLRLVEETGVWLVVPASGERGA